MGICYTEIALGEIEGQQQALQSGKELWDYTRSGNFPIYEPGKIVQYGFATYWMGFGLGYEKGLKLRKRLYDAESDLPFEERISCYAFVLKKQEGCGKPIAAPYLDYIDRWGLLHNIPEAVSDKALAFLAENRLQPALLELEGFYKAQFQLKAAIALYTLLQRLAELRQAKVKDKNFDTAPGKALLEETLRAWIGEHTNRH